MTGEIVGVTQKRCPSVDIRVVLTDDPEDVGVLFVSVAMIGSNNAPGPVDSDSAWSWQD